jgi:hypothetical protein
MGAWSAAKLGQRHHDVDPAVAIAAVDRVKLGG